MPENTEEDLDDNEPADEGEREIQKWNSPLISHAVHV